MVTAGPPALTLIGVNAVVGVPGRVAVAGADVAEALPARSSATTR